MSRLLIVLLLEHSFPVSHLSFVFAQSSANQFPHWRLSIPQDLSFSVWLSLIIQLQCFHSLSLFCSVWSMVSCIYLASLHAFENFFLFLVHYCDVQNANPILLRQDNIFFNLYVYCISWSSYKSPQLHRSLIIIFSRIFKIHIPNNCAC